MMRPSQLPARADMRRETRDVGVASLPTDAGKRPTAGVFRRRGLLVAAAGGIVTMTSRRSLAHGCGVSNAMSVNPSMVTGATCMGYGPGYWKNNPSAWPPPFVAVGGPFRNATLWKDIFGTIGIARVDNPSGTFLLALNQGLTAIGSTSAAVNQLPAQCVASVLNAAQFGASGFGFDVRGIVSFIEQNWRYQPQHPTDPADLNTILTMLNSRS